MTESILGAIGNTPLVRLARAVKDCPFVGCRRLVWREAILAGRSSGGVLMAVEKVKWRIPRRATCAVILHDRGERHLDTIYSDEWVEEHLGDIAHLWQDHRGTRPWSPAAS